MSKKKKKPIKIRQFWTRCPVEKIKVSGKIYSRKKKQKESDNNDPRKNHRIVA